VGVVAVANEQIILRKGESLPFEFDRSGEKIENWICTIKVKKFPSDAVSIDRIIPPVRRTWPGFLTSLETDALSNGVYRIVGLLTNATTGEEEQVVDTVRFKLGQSWA